MEFRVTDLLNLESLKDAVVVSGQQHLHHSIKGVTIMEAPDIAEWLKGGELLLTSLYPIRNFDSEEQRSFIARLVEKGASALVIKNHRFVPEIPEPLLKAGDDIGLPIIQIPKDVPYVDVMYPVMGELFNRQVKKLQYYKEIHDRFTTLSLANEGPEQIIKTLEALIENPVALFDRNFHCIATTEPALANFEIIEKIPYYEQTSEMKFPHYRQMVKYQELEGQIGHQIVVPVDTINHTRTYLLIGEMNKPLEELNFIAVENAATSLSLELVKQFAVAEVEKKYKNDLIEDLVSGRMQSINSVYEKANVIGWDLDGSFAAVLFKITSSRKSMSANETNENISFVYDAVHQHFPKGILTTKSNFVILLLKVENKKMIGWVDKIKKAAEEIRKSIKKQFREIAVQAGIGNVADSIMDVPQSYKEALEALELGQTVFGDEAITIFSELGIMRLLCNFDNPATLSDYIPSTLKKLLDYPHANKADLIKTLRTFLECNQNATKTSQMLFLHYKTVVYRLERIKDITGMNFEDPEEMLSVQVGLKIVDLLERNKQLTN